MLRFSEFIVESGDSSYPVDHTVKPNHPRDTYNEYHFKDHKGSNYNITIHHENVSLKAHVEFGNDSVPEYKSQGITGESGKDSHKILSTIHNVLKKHAKENTKIKSYHFSSSEPSRHKLYSRYAEKMGGNTEFQVDPESKEIIGYHHHRIPASSLRD